jgi:hypothetical protein
LDAFKVNNKIALQVYSDIKPPPLVEDPERCKRFGENQKGTFLPLFGM